MGNRVRWHRNLSLFLAVFLLGAVPAATAAVSADQVSTTSVIVQGASAGAARDAVEAAGGEVTRDLWIVNGVAAEVPSDALAAVSAAPGVLTVSADEAVQVQANPSPLHAATAVYPKVVGADRLWSEGVQGEGVTVAVVDTGIAPVADLAGRVIAGVDFSEDDPLSDQDDDDAFVDEFGHGTFIAGLIAGNGASSNGHYKGVAPQAKLVSIKIAGREGASDISHVLAGIQWAVSFKDDYGIRVLNLSLGSDSAQTYQLSPLNAAVEKAWDAGIVVTVSASNTGPGAGTITKPADDPLVVTVGALDDKGSPGRGDDVMAGFSGEGPTAADGLAKPDLVAPGRSVISLRAPGSKVDAAYPGSRVGSAYFKGSGTSFATAITSGSAALLLQREPGLTPDQVKARLTSTAGPGPVGNPNVDGHGSLNAHAAAHAGTFEAANQGVTRSAGTGSLAVDRGSLDVRIQTSWLLDPVLGLLLPVWELLYDNYTAQNLVFDAVEYLESEWTGNRWYESQWGGNRWYVTDWSGNRWYGNRWYESDWWGNRWYAIAWE